MGLGLTLSLALAAAPPFDPRIDRAREPPQGWSLGAGLERQGETFGVAIELRGPRWLDDRFALSAAGGLGWLTRAGLGPEQAGAWSPFFHGRLRAEFGLSVADGPHRLFIGLGPSAVVPSSDRSSAGFAPGVHGGLGVELFSGDRFRTGRVALVFEVGAAAHLAREDSGRGEVEAAPPLATGLALSAQVRFYPPG